MGGFALLISCFVSRPLSQPYPTRSALHSWARPVIPSKLFSLEMFSYFLSPNKEFTVFALHIICPLTERDTRCFIRPLTLCADQLASLSNAEKWVHNPRKWVNCCSLTWDLFTTPVDDSMYFMPGLPGTSNGALVTPTDSTEEPIRPSTRLVLRLSFDLAHIHCLHPVF